MINVPVASFSMVEMAHVSRGCSIPAVLDSFQTSNAKLYLPIYIAGLDLPKSHHRIGLLNSLPQFNQIYHLKTVPPKNRHNRSRQSADLGWVPFLQCVADA